MKHVKDATLSALLDGELKVEKSELARTHLASCSSCAARLAELERIRHALQRLPQARPDRRVGLAAIRYRATRTEAASSGEARPLHRLRPLWAGLGALAAGLILYFSLLHPGSPNPGKAAPETCIIEQETGDIIQGYQDIARFYD